MTTTTTTPNRVADPSVSFWTIKVLSTGAGEASSDFLVTRFDPVPTVLVTGVLFLVVLVVQVGGGRYRPWSYWGAVVMVAVFGTMVADVVHVALGVSYIVSTPVSLLVLVAVFLLWRRTEGTLDVHAVTTTRRQAFYWTAVIATFALGTAAGDLLAAEFHLGYLAAGVVFLGAMAVVVAARLTTLLRPVAGFWTAYVLTRPVGASFADWVAVPRTRGGLDLGPGLVSTVLLLAVGAAVAWSDASRCRAAR